MLPKLHHLLCLGLVSNVAAFTFPSLLSSILHRECQTPGIVDVRVLFDSYDEVPGMINHYHHCAGAIVRQRLFSNLSFGQHFRKSRLNVVYISDASEKKLWQIGDYIKQTANYDWSAKYLFHLPSLTLNQVNNFTSLAAILTKNRFYNNLFTINHAHLITYNVLNGAILRHNDTHAAVHVLFQDKFQQMHRYRLEDLADAEVYPFHSVDYGHKKIYNREAYFINMLVDRLNISMMERHEEKEIIFQQQFNDRMKENSIIATFGYTNPGDFRRIYTHDMEGLCVVTRNIFVSTVLDDLIDPFDRFIWIFWFICSEFTAMVCTFVKYRNSTTSRTLFAWIREYAGFHLVLLQCCVLMPPTHMKIHRVVQLLIFCYLLAVFNIATIYISSVTSNLSIRRYDKGPQTVRDLIDQQTPIFSSEIHKQMVEQAGLNFTYNYEGDAVASLMPCSSAEFVVKHSVALLRPIREPLFPHYIVYMLHKESILQEVLERYVALTYQANLYHYWDNFMVKRLLKPHNAHVLMADVIKFEEIIWLFVMLPVGGMLGMVALLLEIVYYRWTKRRTGENSAMA